MCFNDDLEDIWKPPKSLIKIPLLYGNSRAQKTAVSTYQKAEAEVSGYAKCVFIQEKKGMTVEDKTKLLQEILKPSDYVCRVYITKGMSMSLEPT